MLAGGIALFGLFSAAAAAAGRVCSREVYRFLVFLQLLNLLEGGRTPRLLVFVELRFTCLREVYRFLVFLQPLHTSEGGIPISGLS